jgi:hypothetical protein
MFVILHRDFFFFRNFCNIKKCPPPPGCAVLQWACSCIPPPPSERRLLLHRQRGVSTGKADGRLGLYWTRRGRRRGRGYIHWGSPSTQHTPSFYKAAAFWVLFCSFLQRP